MSQTNVPIEYYHKAEPAAKFSGKWWEQKEDAIHETVFPLVKRLQEAQAYRNQMNLRYARLYQNMEIISLKAGHYARVPDIKSFMTNRMTYNVIKSVIDTGCAKISKEKPRPVFLTENGTWTLQQKAKRLSQFIQGVFHTIGTGTGDHKTMYGLGRQAFKDCGIFGTGATYFFDDENEVKAERALIDEIVIDDIEAMYGFPRQIHRVRQVNRDVLMSLYPKHRRAIQEAVSIQSLANAVDTGTDMLDVIESWHLRSSKDAKDGKHSICIENCTLRPERYDDDYFPFLFQRWCNKTLGFFGGGIAEELVGIQLEINKILRTISISQHLAAVPQVWLEAANKIPGKTINNEIGGIKYYVGKPPIIFTPTAQNAEMYNHLENLFQKAYETTGFSQLSASGKKPAGLDAAVAIREAQDIESERFSIPQIMYEDYFMDATDLIYKMCEKLLAKGKDPVVQFKDGNSMKTIKFSDVRIANNKFTVRAYPTNFLPSAPSGKLQTVTEMIQAGFYTKEEAQELLDYPDLKKVQNLKTAQREDILKVLEKMIDEEVYQSPEPYMNLDLAKGLAQSYYLRCRCDDAPENVLDLLRTFMDDVQALIDLQSEKANPPPSPELAPPPSNVPPPPGMEQIPSNQEVATGVPIAPPETPLMPNNPNIAAAA